jgi:hypothetical protein
VAGDAPSAERNVEDVRVNPAQNPRRRLRPESIGFLELWLLHISGRFVFVVTRRNSVLDPISGRRICRSDYYVPGVGFNFNVYSATCNYEQNCGCSEG